MGLSNLLERSRPVEEQVLSDPEFARALRDTTLDMFHYGVYGSNLLMPSEPKRDAIKLPHLLRYSEKTLKHYQTLMGVLSAPREFKIVKKTSDNWDTPDGDVLYEYFDGTDIYHFAHHLTSPYINAFASALDTITNNKPSLNINILKRGPIWHVHYLYQKPNYSSNVSDPDYPQFQYSLMREIIGTSRLVNPQRTHLLNFTLSPNPFNAKHFLNNEAESTREHIHPIKTRQIDTFQVHQIGFSAHQMAAQLRKVDYFTPQRLHSYWSAEIYALEKDGDREFSIVNLGKMAIGNLTYHVYTASEQPLVREKKPMTSGAKSAIPSLTPQSI